MISHQFPHPWLLHVGQNSFSVATIITRSWFPCRPRLHGWGKLQKFNETYESQAHPEQWNWSRLLDGSASIKPGCMEDRIRLLYPISINQRRWHHYHRSTAITHLRFFAFLLSDSVSLPLGPWWTLSYHELLNLLRRLSWPNSKRPGRGRCRFGWGETRLNNSNADALVTHFVLIVFMLCAFMDGNGRQIPRQSGCHPDELTQIFELQRFAVWCQSRR